MYADDIICFSTNNYNEHRDKLKEIFERLRAANLTLNLKKCNFFTQQTKYLGHIVSGEGIKPDPDKISAVENYPIPKTPTDIRAFLGLTGFYRRFIPDYSTITIPLTRLLKKDQKFDWTQETQNVFDKLRKALCEEPILKFPDFNKEFILCTDASSFAISAVLCQDYDGHELPVSYASRQLTKSEQAYSTTDRETLALLWGIKHYHCYLYGRHFKVYVDHQPLKWQITNNDPTNRRTRWALKLAEYDFIINYRPGKNHQNADALSRIRPIRVLRSLNCEPIVWDRELLLKEQRADTKLSDIIQPMLDGKPNEYFFLDVDGILYRESDDLNVEGRLVVPEKLKNHFMYMCHDSPLTGHFGADKTHDRARIRFYWSGMYEDIKRYVNSCVSCAKRKTSPHTRPAPLKKSLPTSKPFHRIAMDVVGPLVTTVTGNKYILTVQDSFTRYLEAFPMTDQTAPTVAKHFAKGIILRYGVPRQILTDLGTNFLSKLMKELFKVLGIQHLRTTAYRPQTNGMIERTHRSLKDLLSHYINDEHRDWDEWLPFAVSAYCSARHSTTGESPYFLLFGRDIELPYDELFKPIRIKYDSDQNYVSEFMQRMKIAHQKALDHSCQATARVHNYFNKKTKPPDYILGDKVYLYDPVVKSGLSAKLAKKWTGPYRIIDLHDVNATIKDIYGQKSQKVHVNRLKPFYERDEKTDLETRLELVSDENNPVTNYCPSPLLNTSVSLPCWHNFQNSPLSPTLRTQDSPGSSSFVPITEETVVSTLTDVSCATEVPVDNDITPPPRYHTRSRGQVPNIPWIREERV